MEENKKETNSTKEEQKKKRGILIIIILIIAIAAAGITAAFAVKSNTAQESVEENNDKGVGMTIEEDDGEYVASDEDDAESRPGVAIPGWGTIRIAADQTDVEVDFYNPEDNKGYYYLTYEILLPDEESEDGYETIYASGLIQPGDHVRNITLEHPLEAGEYEAVIHVQPYAIEDETPTNNANFDTIIIAESLQE